MTVGRGGRSLAVTTDRRFGHGPTGSGDPWEPSFWATTRPAHPTYDLRAPPRGADGSGSTRAIGRDRRDAPYYSLHWLLRRSQQCQSGEEDIEAAFKFHGAVIRGEDRREAA